MNKYSVLKLSNGEDIICRIVDSSKEKVKIEDPLLLDVQQITDKDGRILYISKVDKLNIEND